MAQDASTATSLRPDNVPADRVIDIDMYNPEGIEEGYLNAWKRLQSDDCPNLVWTPRNGGHWIATRGATIREIYRDTAHFSSKVLFIPKAAGEKYAMVPSKMDPPEHRPYREVVNNGLNLRRVREMEPRIRNIAEELIAGFAERGSCDFSREFAQIFPISVFMTIADLPMDDAHLLQKFASDMTRPDGNTPEEMAEALDRANKGFFDYVSPIIDARKGNQADDIISMAVNSKIDGEDMARDKMLGMISLLLLAGLDTVVNFLSMVMHYLANSPDHQKALGADPANIARKVEELFRRFPLVAAARMVAKDTEYDHVTLREGEMVLLPTALHGLDERENANPWVLDFSRKGISHSTFGEGPHRCAGLHLARTEVTITLEEWFKRIPLFREAPDSRPTYHSGIVAAVEGLKLEW